MRDFISRNKLLLYLVAGTIATAIIIVLLILTPPKNLFGIKNKQIVTSSELPNITIETDNSKLQRYLNSFDFYNLETVTTPEGSIKDLALKNINVIDLKFTNTPQESFQVFSPETDELIVSSGYKISENGDESTLVIMLHIEPSHLSQLTQNEINRTLTKLVLHSLYNLQYGKYSHLIEQPSADRIDFYGEANRVVENNFETFGEIVTLSNY